MARLSLVHSLGGLFVVVLFPPCLPHGAHACRYALYEDLVRGRAPPFVMVKSNLVLPDFMKHLKPLVKDAYVPCM